MSAISFSRFNVSNSSPLAFSCGVSSRGSCLASSWSSIYCSGARNSLLPCQSEWYSGSPQSGDMMPCNLPPASSAGGGISPRTWSAYFSSRFPRSIALICRSMSFSFALAFCFRLFNCARRALESSSSGMPSSTLRLIRRIVFSSFSTNFFSCRKD